LYKHKPVGGQKLPPAFLFNLIKNDHSTVIQLQGVILTNNMAFPTILIDSINGGSDTLASGAGPSIALTGSAASTSGDGLTVTLDGSPDLTNVATDGSHAIFLNDTTAGNRNFGKITNKDNGAKTVTVSNAFGISLSGKSWAIGGKRASVGSTTSKKLFDNNGTSGDAMPGWIVELQSGHSETITARLNIWRIGDTTDGPITFRGVASGTLPVLTFSDNDHGIICREANQIVERMELASSGTKGSNSSAVAFVAAVRLRFLKIVTSGSNKWVNGFNTLNNFGIFISNCEIANTSGAGIVIAGGGNNGAIKITGCYIHDCGSHGVSLLDSHFFGINITDNIFYNNVGDGIALKNERNDQLGAGTVISKNTFHNNGGDGLDIGNWNDSLRLNVIENNIFKNCLYGIKFSNVSATAIGLHAYTITIRNNCFHNNTSGKYLPNDLISEDEQTVDPEFTNPAGDDFSIGDNLKALGFPTDNLGITRSYVDIGAAQRQETGSNIIIIKTKKM
jgi:hypothetical protein